MSNQIHTKIRLNSKTSPYDAPMLGAPEQDFSGYRLFTDELLSLLSCRRLDNTWNDKVNASLDGVAGIQLRKLVDLPVRRAAGAFFTGSTLAERLVGVRKFRVAKDFIYDPTVGAGDLLLAAARLLPIKTSLKKTLVAWGQCLGGTDLQREFIDATQLRIALLARQRHGGGELPENWRSLLPFIRPADGLQENSLFTKATYLLMNPPFGLTPANKECTWASGRVSEAAIFIIKALESIKPNTKVLAILPDVLRSGSFQRQWRNRVSELALVQSIERYGVFDSSADVDVFLLELQSRGPSRVAKKWPVTRKTKGTTLASYFDVHVGSVVPHRDPQTGRLCRYIHPRNIPVWKELKQIPDKRRHKGTIFKPPFVVLRRTSRPGDPYRAAATVILGTTPVAVENHLIVCKPLDGDTASCQNLMTQLRTERVNNFLDERISCRHLTVSAVKDIPIKF